MPTAPPSPPQKNYINIFAFSIIESKMSKIVALAKLHFVTVLELVDTHRTPAACGRWPRTLGSSRDSPR